MANRLTVSRRALREIGDAYEWYDEQVPGLGQAFLAELETQLEIIVQSPQHYAEIQRGIRRTLLSRFPYGVFYAWQGEMVSVLAVVHTARHPRRWPRPR